MYMYDIDGTGPSALFGDGSGGVMWFAGLGTESWINEKGLTAQEYTRNAKLLVEHPIQALSTAVRNFHRYFLWVGILEQYEDSLDLFQYQTNLTLVENARVRRENANVLGKSPRVSDVDKRILATAFPLDNAFYAYVRAVQSARMDWYKGQINGSGSSPVRFCKNQTEWANVLAFPFYFNGTKIWPITV